MGMLDVSSGLIIVTTSRCTLQACRIIQENLKNETDFVSPISSHKIPNVSGSSVSQLYGKGKSVPKQQHIAMAFFQHAKIFLSSAPRF